MANKIINPKRKNELRYEGIEFLQASGWQRSNPEHPSGNGKIGYRAVYKTLKLILFPSVNLSWPNLKVRLDVDSVEYGGFNVKGNAIPSIFPNRLLLPEYIEIRKDNQSTTYHGETNMKWEFSAHVKEFPTSGIVELLLEMDNVNENDIITNGRRRLSPILSILDLVYGERIIGALIAEEVVELFSDGHWNRKVISPFVGSESQLNMKKIENSQIEQMRESINVYQKFSESDRRKLALATDWFWKSERESDSVDRFIQLWICLETLEMPTTNIKPIIKQLSIITPESSDFWAEPIGRLYGKRSNLVHGISNDVDEYEIVILRGLAKILLANQLGKIEDPKLVDNVISLIKTHFKQEKQN